MTDSADEQSMYITCQLDEIIAAHVDENASGFTRKMRIYDAARSVRHYS